MLLTIMNLGRVLDLYDEGTPEWGPKEASTALGLGKSTTHELMSSMAEVGLLRRVPGGRYRPGWRALQLEGLVSRSAPFRAHAHELAAGVARHCGETLHVAALDGGRVVYVDRVQGVRGVEVEAASIGHSLPTHCSGVGKALLAHLAPGEVDAILDKHGLPRFTEHTITDRDALYAELHRVRRDGVAYDREEAVEGLSCVAAPIHDADGVVVAAMSISMPTERFEASVDAYRSVILRATSAVSARLRPLKGATASPVGGSGPT